MGEEFIRLYTRSKNRDWSGSDGGAVDIYHDTCGYVYFIFGHPFSVFVKVSLALRLPSKEWCGMTATA